MSSAPRLLPSSLNWTPTTPTLSVAVAVTGIVPDTVSPVCGEVIETEGGVESLVGFSRSWEGTLTRNASRRSADMLLVQLK